MGFFWIPLSDTYWSSDLAILLGKPTGGSGSGSTTEGLILGISIAVPLAGMCVVSVISGILVVAWVRARRTKKGLMVNFDGDEQPLAGL